MCEGCKCSFYDGDPIGQVLQLGNLYWFRCFHCQVPNDGQWKPASQYPAIAARYAKAPVKGGGGAPKYGTDFARGTNRFEEMATTPADKMTDEDLREVLPGILKERARLYELFDKAKEGTKEKTNFELDYMKYCLKTVSFVRQGNARRL